MTAPQVVHATQVIRPRAGMRWWLFRCTCGETRRCRTETGARHVELLHLQAAS